MEHGAKPGVGAVGTPGTKERRRPKLLKRRGCAGRLHTRQTAGEGAGRRSPGRGSLGAPPPHRPPRPSRRSPCGAGAPALVDAWSPVTRRPPCRGCVPVAGLPHPRVADGPGTPGTRVGAGEDSSRCWLRVKPGPTRWHCRPCKQRHSRKAALPLPREHLPVSARSEHVGGKEGGVWSRLRGEPWGGGGSPVI